MEIVGCQVCLKVIKSPSEGFFYNAIHNPGNVLVKDMLMGCVPGLLVERAHHVGICFSCMPSLTKAYEFQQQCMRSQYDVINYLKDRKLPDTSINIGEVAMYYSSRQIFEVVDQSQIKMNYSCLLCTFSCTDHCTIRLHTILHNSKRGPYKCDQCPFIFPTADLLLQHIALHTGEKPYSCSLCTFGTTDAVELKEHNNAHRKPYQCNMCWIRFDEEYQMFRHMKNDHRKRYQVYFRCELCDYSGFDPDEMDSHINKTHKIFICTLCPSEFVTSSAFKKHVASHKSKNNILKFSENNDHKDRGQNINPEMANVFNIAVSKPFDSSLEMCVTPERALNVRGTSAPLQSNNNINMENLNQFGGMGISNANVKVIDTNWSLQNNNVNFEAPNQIGASVSNENVQAVNTNWSLQSKRLEAPNQLGVALANVPNANVQAIRTNWSLQSNNVQFEPPNEFDVLASRLGANVQAIDAHKNDDKIERSFKGKYRVFDQKTRSAVSGHQEVQSSTSTSIKTSDNRTKQCKFCSFECQSLMALESHERFHFKVGSETENKRASKSPAPASSEIFSMDTKRSKSKSLKMLGCKLCGFKCESDDVLKRHKTAVHEGDPTELKKLNCIPTKFKSRPRSPAIAIRNSDTADPKKSKPEELNANNQKPVATEIKAISVPTTENMLKAVSSKHFKCAICSRLYGSKSGLKQHRKRIHRKGLLQQNN